MEIAASEQRIGNLDSDRQADIVIAARSERDDLGPSPETGKRPRKNRRPLPARNIAAALCVIAAARVFIFSAAFPFFNNVDEQDHADMVVKYAHGYLSRGLTQFGVESARYFSLYYTPEFFRGPEQFPGGRFPQPAWMLPAEEQERLITKKIEWWQHHPNSESTEPPLYYAIAGVWLNLGRLSGLEGPWLLYWVRFLNSFIVAGIVWTGFVTARLVFPEQPIFHLGMPLLLALWPQSSLYSVQSDVLSPLSFGITFFWLLNLTSSESPTALASMATGLAAAATCLIKATNLPLLALVAAFVAIWSWQLLRARKGWTAWVAPISMALCVALPVVIWSAWNYHTCNDLTGAATKLKLLGWTRKPLSEWWSHPLLTVGGFKVFWSTLLATFWRGEFVWHAKRLTLPAADLFYWISSAVVIAVAAVNLVQRRVIRDFQWRAVLLAFSSFVIFVLYLGILSMAFDFGNCPYPSRAHPYFTSGRLMSAAMVPFAMLYVYALESLLRPLNKQWPQFLILGSSALAITVSELIVTWPVFASQYNFFHLLARVAGAPPCI